MTLEIITNTDAKAVILPQKFDAITAPDTESGLKSLLATAPEKLILDFSRTEYVASAGLRVILLVTREQLKAKRKVVLVGVRPQISKIFDMAGFTSLFTIAATQDEALRIMA